MPLDDINLEDKNIFIPNNSPDWSKEPSPDRHLCIHNGHQDGCEHFRPPPCPDPRMSHEANDNLPTVMSLQEDLNILANIEFSSDDEHPDLI